MLTDDEWAAVLLHLHSYGLEIVAADRMSGRIVLQVPTINDVAVECDA